MFLTQSALSHQIKDLKGRLGCSLFLRKTRQVRFTSAGNRLLQRLHSAELDLDRFAGGQSGRIIMAIECHSCFEWLLPAIDAYRNEWSDVELDISSGFHFAPFPALARGDLDLVITAIPQTSLALLTSPFLATKPNLQWPKGTRWWKGLGPSQGTLLTR